MKKSYKRTILPKIIAFFLLSATYAYAQVTLPPTVALVPSSASIFPDDGFSVDVFADVTVADPDQVIAFGFDVITPMGIDFLGATVNTAFVDTSASHANTHVAGHTFPGVSGNILLATLDFNATNLELENYLLNIESDTNDPNEGLFTFMSTSFPSAFQIFDMDSSVQVSVVPVVVPEPSSFSLLMAFFGLGAVALRMEKRINRV